MDSIWPNSSKRDVTSDCWVFLSSCPTQSVVLQTRNIIRKRLGSLKEKSKRTAEKDQQLSYMMAHTTECLTLYAGETFLSTFSVFLALIPVLRIGVGSPASLSGTGASMPRSLWARRRSWSSPWRSKTQIS